MDQRVLNADLKQLFSSSFDSLEAPGGLVELARSIKALRTPSRGTFVELGKLVLEEKLRNIEKDMPKSAVTLCALTLHAMGAATAAHWDVVFKLFGAEADRIFSRHSQFFVAYGPYDPLVTSMLKSFGSEVKRCVLPYTSGVKGWPLRPRLWRPSKAPLLVARDFPAPRRRICEEVVLPQ